MRKAVHAALAGLVLVAAAKGAGAQVTQTGKFTVTPMIGEIHWDDASALANKKAGTGGQFNKTTYTPTLGMTAEYNLTRQIGAGFYFEAARPTTRGDYFPSVLFNFGANLPAELRVVSQRVTVLMYGVQGSLNIPARLSPYVSGGIGGVTVNTDPEQSNSNGTFSGGAFHVGGGIGFQLGSATAFKIDVRDHVFTSWKRDRLNLVNPSFQNTLFPSANATPPAAKNTVHNFQIALGLSFVPKRSEPTSDQPQE